jgi:hypothetical protein
VLGRLTESIERRSDARWVLDVVVPQFVDLAGVSRSRDGAGSERILETASRAGRLGDKHRDVLETGGTMVALFATRSHGGFDQQAILVTKKPGFFGLARQS